MATTQKCPTCKRRVELYLVAGRWHFHAHRDNDGGVCTGSNTACHNARGRK